MNIDLNNLTEKKPVIKNTKMVFDILLDNGTAGLELYGLEYNGALTYGDDEGTKWLHRSGTHDRILPVVKEVFENVRSR